MLPDFSRPSKLSITRLDRVRAESVNWLWDSRIPLGKLTLISGDPGVGKSFLTLDIAAHVSKGNDWPDNTKSPVGNVILFSAEDGVNDTIRPRLDKLDADLAHIHFANATLFDDGIEIGVSLDKHLAALEDAIKQHDASLLVLDPLLAFIGKRTDSHITADVRALMSPLAALADRTSCAILGVGHLNKNSKETKTLYRLTASVDFPAAARSVFVVGKNPLNPDQRVLASVKSNLSAPPSSLAFHFTDDGSFIWDGKVDIDADSMLATADIRGPRARDEARAFLHSILKDGRVRSNEVIQEAKQLGISEKTLRRAKDDKGIEVVRIGENGSHGGGVWWWNLPTV